MKVADLSAATLGSDMQTIPGTAFQQYVTRWQMGNTIYYAMMETNGSQRTTGTDQFYAGAAQSVDLCSVSACDPHVIYYPEVGTTARTARRAASRARQRRRQPPCTITITLNTADVGAPTNSSLLEEVGSYAFASSHLQAAISTRRRRPTTFRSRSTGSAASTSRPPRVVVVAEAPWAPGLIGLGSATVLAALVQRRRRRAGRHRSVQARR